MARLYANENFPFRVVRELRLLGHDVLTVQETGKANIRTPDLQIVEFAKSNERAVLTLNRKHFIAIHNRNPNHAGIVVCSADSDSVGLARRIDVSLEGIAHLEGVLLRIYREHH